MIRSFAPAMAALPAALAIGACSPASGTGVPETPWLGKTYVLTVPSTNWTEPSAMIGGDIGAFVPQFLITIGQSSDGDFPVTLGTGSAGAQDMCNPTTQVTASGSGYPNATITAPAFPMRIVNTVSNVVVNATIQNLTLTNVLPGSAPAKDGTLQATVDISELYPLFNQVPTSQRTKDGVCTALGSAGANCGPCPGTGQPYCLTLEAVQLGAVAGTTAVKPLAAADIAASCNIVDSGAPGGMTTEDSGTAVEAGSESTMEAGSQSVMEAGSAADTGTHGGADAAASTDAGASADAKSTGDARGDSQ